MKRIFLTILSVMAILPVVAQTDTTQHRIDTVEFPLNLPYYENDWTNGRDLYEFTSYELVHTFPIIDIRRYDIPGDSLKIIGLAGVFGIVTRLQNHTYIDTTRNVQERMPEYLQLYECTPDTLRLIKEKSWKDVEPRCCLKLWTETRYLRYPNLYEIYFDEPIMVKDSFYVGGTEENNFREVSLGVVEFLETTKYDVLPLNKVDSIVVAGRIAHAAGHPLDTTRWYCGKTLHEYMLFPIIDTTGMTPPDTAQGGDTTIVDTTVLDTTGISRLADQFSRILPNPTTGHAVVHSSIPMRSVAVYDPAGRCILRRRVDGTIAQLDLEGHARGQYYVVIETPAGRALKRLLLQ